MAQSRNWLFTINNPSDLDYPEVWKKDSVRLLLYQVEIGEEGTLHLQGYLELTSSRRLEYLRRTFSDRAHWEKRKGSALQAAVYCSKQETRLAGPNLWISGSDTPDWILLDQDCTEQTLCSKIPWLSKGGKKGNIGKSADRLQKIRSMLQDGSASLKDIADNEFDLWVRHFRAFEAYASMSTSPRNHEVDVHVLIGPTGTGKSKWALDTYPSAYWKQRSKWWDGYFKHETIIIDEFYGWLPFDLLLRICDRYPVLVETKGGQMQFVAKTIVITSNTPIDRWYSDNCYIDALVRRISHFHYMPSLGMHVTYNAYQAFKQVCEANPLLQTFVKDPKVLSL